MAPESTLALCALGDTLSNARIMLACRNLVNYAKEEGKPLVVNLSIAEVSGAHDGTDDFSEMAKELSAEGVIFVVGSGNYADKNMYLNEKFTADNQSVITLLSSDNYAGNIYSNYFELYTFTGEFPRMAFIVVDRTTNEVLYDMDDKVLTFEKGMTYDFSQSDYATKFSEYYDSLSITMGAASDGKICGLGVSITGKAKVNDKYYIGIYIDGGVEENEIHMWACDLACSFVDNGSTDFTAGDGTCSISSMACNDDVISVGAYAYASNWTDINGEGWRYTDATDGDIALFSSYGVDMNGVARPDACTPGVAILSAYNSYNTGMDASYIVSQMESGGRTYQWGVMRGTSMATPMMTGMIATWLQYKPTLTVAEIRELLKSTSVKDDYVNAGNSVQWGAGKVDSYAVLQRLITSGVNDVEVSQDNVLVYPNPNGGQFKVFAQGEYNGATLNVYNMAGTLVYSEPIDASQDAVDVDLSGSLSSGIYVVNVTGEKVNYSTRMIVK